MEYFVYLVMLIAVGWGCWYAKKKIDALTLEEETNTKRKLIASYTTGVHKRDNPANTWYVSCYVYSDGSINFEGSMSKEYMEQKDKGFQKFILPLAHGVALSGQEKIQAKAAGVSFY